jgi:hypothetical protein
MDNKILHTILNIFLHFFPFRKTVDSDILRKISKPIIRSIRKAI